MQGLSGRLDEVGRKNLDRDIISTTVGHDLANRYLPISAEPRPTVDVKIAFLENQQLTGGNPVPVVSNEMHGIHLETHMPALAQIIEGIETGEVDPQGAIGPLQALYQHISDTAQAAAGDVNLENIVSEANQLLQFAEEQINNTFKALQKIQRDQAQAQEQEQAPQEGGQAPQEEDQAPTVDLKVQEAEVKMDIARRKAELDMEIRQRKFDQEMAIRDAQAAMKFRESGTV